MSRDATDSNPLRLINSNSVLAAASTDSEWVACRLEILGQKVPIRAAMGRNHGQGSCAGMPCLILPAGMSSTGLPIGFEFDALPGNDRDLLALGFSLEQALGPIPAPRI